MADQQRDQQSGADQTVVFPAVQWPSAEPDAAAPPRPGHIDCLDTSDGPMQAPTDGVYSPRPDGSRQDGARSDGPRPDAQRQHGPRGPGAGNNGPQPGDDRTQASRSDGPHSEALRHDGPRTQVVGPDGSRTQVVGPDGSRTQAVRTEMLRPAGPPSAQSPAPPGPPQPPADYLAAGEDGPPPRNRRLARRGALAGAVAVGVLGLLYGADLAMASGEVPRGVTVAGVEVGGLDRAAAEQRLHDQVAPRLTQPVAVRVGDVEATVDPADAGLALDWPATLDQAGNQPLNPITRLSSFFSDREVGVVTRADSSRLTTTLDALREQTSREPAEGNIQFEGTTPVAVDPRAGQQLDVPAAVDVLKAQWAGGRTVDLPVTSTPVRSTPETVRAALESIAKPAVSAPVTVAGEGAQATLTPEVIAAALSFEVGPDGTLIPKYDTEKMLEALRPQLAKTEKPGKDATVVLEGGRPVVKPSVDGHGVDWAKSLEPLPDVLRSADNRALTAIYSDQPAKFTTEQANGLGIKEVIGEFTTRGFAADSGVNIRVIAAEVNGALVKPGATFSLNNHTGPRGTAQGYVEAGIIEKGRPGRAVGGGCSQFATTLFNAAYFAGMTDVAHKEHSYYISRYPEGREATVFEGQIDLAFRNDAPTGALIETIWTPSSVTVRIWGTKHYEVESITSGRSNFTNPTTVTIPHGEKCTAGPGSQGFTVTNTRVVRDARTGAEVKRNSRTVVYNPVPKIVCGSPPGQTDPPAPGG